MKASYEKKKDHYILKLDNLKFRIPFVYNKGSITEVHISDTVMDMLVYKYNNEGLQLIYNGKPITDKDIEEIYKDNIKFENVKFTAKGGWK